MRTWGFYWQGIAELNREAARLQLRVKRSSVNGQKNHHQRLGINVTLGR